MKNELTNYSPSPGHEEDVGHRSHSISASPERRTHRSPKETSRRESPRRHRSRSRERSRRKHRSRSPVLPYSGARRGRGGKPDPDIAKPSRCLGVFGMSVYTSEKDLKEAFGRYGPISDVQLIYDRPTGKSRGFGFLYFESKDDAVAAKEGMTDKEIDGHQIRVDFSFTKRPHSPTPGQYMGRGGGPTRGSFRGGPPFRGAFRGGYGGPPPDAYYDRGDSYYRPPPPMYHRDYDYEDPYAPPAYSGGRYGHPPPREEYYDRSPSHRSSRAHRSRRSPSPRHRRSHRSDSYY